MVGKKSSKRVLSVGLLQQAKGKYKGPRPVVGTKRSSGGDGGDDEGEEEEEEEKEEEAARAPSPKQKKARKQQAKSGKVKSGKAKGADGANEVYDLAAGDEVKAGFQWDSDDE